MKGALLAAVLCFACGGTSLDLGDAALSDAAIDTTIFDAGDATTSDASPCGANEVLCGTTCYPNDVNHCGPTCTTCGAPALGQATCNGTTCGFTCTFLQCGSTCVDPSADTHNCGSCAHDCLGQVCASSVCQPQELYTDSPASAIVVDSTNLYWTVPDETVNDVWYGPKGGGTATRICSCANVPALAIDATNVYVLGGSDSILYAPIGTTNISGVNILPPGGTYDNDVFLVDSQNFYYAVGLYQTTLTAMALDAGSGGVISTEYRINWFGRQTGRTFVAWQDNASLSHFGPVNVDGGADTYMTTDAGPIFSFGLDSNNAYLGAEYGLYQTPLDGGAATLLWTPVYGVSNVVTDGVSIYWLDGATVYQTPVGTTNRVPMTPTYTSGFISALAVDSTYIYFGLTTSSASTSGVYRTAK